jgi:hypothetical protein
MRRLIIATERADVLSAGSLLTTQSSWRLEPMAQSRIPDKVTTAEARRVWRCAFEGCPETSEQPFLDGWVGVASFSGLSNGRYCKAHGAAIRALDEAGEFDDLDDDDD